MPLPKVSRSLSRWPDPAQSIGRQIMSHRLGRRRAWWPRGPALETFEKEIQPSINTILDCVDLCYADILIIPYMIGREPDKANPVVMICCTNRDTRNDVEVRIRSSGLLDKYPGFGLGAAALPLENSAPSRLLGGMQEYRNASEERREDAISYNPYSKARFTGSGGDGGLANVDTDIFVRSPSQTARIGTRLYFEIPSRDDPSPYATGGVIIEVDGEYFQLTISHFPEANATYNLEWGSLSDFEDCHFDVSADDSASDDEAETPYDLLAATSRGSISPESSSSHENTASQNTEELPHDTDMAKSNLPPLHTLGFVPLQPTRVQLDPWLDYALVRIPSSIVQDASNKLECGNTLLVQKIAEIGTEERAVVVVTSSMGPIRGILLPGAISYRLRNETNVQRIMKVELAVAAVEGDCGAAMLDEQTGDLYGHLFLGGTGSLIAYFIPSSDVFQNISSVFGKPVTIFGGQSYDGRFFSNQPDENKFMPGQSMAPTGITPNDWFTFKNFDIDDNLTMGTTLDTGSVYTEEQKRDERPKRRHQDLETYESGQIKKPKAYFQETSFEHMLYSDFMSKVIGPDTAMESRNVDVDTTLDPWSSGNLRSIDQELTATNSGPISTSTTATNSSTSSTVSCPTCEKTYSGKHAKSHLSRHKREHRDKNIQVQCLFCDRIFHHTRTDNIRTHCRKVHQQELPEDGTGRFWKPANPDMVEGQKSRLEPRHSDQAQPSTGPE
ncbi:hypothetical protein F4818DRAFT_425049 [Hypoxylon cercidicola]|nr:hypothetical protein F4818DRAFT_425049 [Hypoxylon cercidicola]